MLLLELQIPDDILYAICKEGIVRQELGLVALFDVLHYLPILVLYLARSLVYSLLQVPLLYCCLPQRGLVYFVR